MLFNIYVEKFIMIIYSSYKYMSFFSICICFPCSKASVFCS